MRRLRRDRAAAKRPARALARSVPPRRRGAAAFVGALVASLAASWIAPVVAFAERTLVEGETAGLYAGGYVRGVGSVSRLAFDLGPEGPENVASTAMIGRLEWRATLASWVGLDLHHRVQMVGTAGGGDLGGAAGVAPGAGTSVTPDRRVDTRTVLRDGSSARRALLDHDIDRAAVRLYLGDHDLVLGRQAIGWGQASIFQATDLFGRLQPFDVDNTQKRGVDAARWMTSHGRWQFDAFVGDGGPGFDVIAGARAEVFLGSMDLQGGVARLRDDVMGLATATVDLGGSSLRAEVLVPFDTRTARATTPSATLGWDRMWGRGTLSLEAHLNGEGVVDRGAILGRLQAISTGQTRSSFVGRWLTSATGLWQPIPTIRLTAVTVANLTDPSALASLGVLWEPIQDLEMSLLAFHGLGAEPEAVPLALRSEFGTLGTTVLAGWVYWY